MSSSLFLGAICILIAILFYLYGAYRAVFCWAIALVETDSKALLSDFLLSWRNNTDHISGPEVPKHKNEKKGKQRIADAMAQASRIIEDAEADPSRQLQDSGVIFLSWLRVLLAFGDVATLCVGLLALLCNVFLGYSVSSWGLPVHIEAVLRSFEPVIAANRRRRNNGVKGGEHGSKGGRPRKENPNGVYEKTPNVYGNQKEKDNVCVSDIEHADESVEAPVTVMGWQNESGLKKKIYFTILTAFFFKNLRNPEKQTEKFLLRYAAEDWAMREADESTTLKEWIQHVNRWHVQDDTALRFELRDLEMWHAVFRLAPKDIQVAMLDQSIRFVERESSVLIVCPAAVTVWIEENTALVYPTILPWLNGRHLEYSNPIK